MKTDTLTGPNLSYHVAVLDGRDYVHIMDGACYYAEKDCPVEPFDYADPATFQPIAEREHISVRWDSVKRNWHATTSNKKSVWCNEKYISNISAIGSTMAEAMMRCYVKSYLGDDTKGE